MRVKNLVVTGDKEKLERLKDEYEYIGFHVRWRDRDLVVFPREPKKRKVRKVVEDDD